MLERLGLIGNCQASALVEASGAVRWCCLPRFDSEPVFGSLLDPQGGHFTVRPPSGAMGTQRYLENTNVLETRFDGPDGSFRVIDFFPRFNLYERIFRPPKLVRIVEPLSGTPMVQVSCEPVVGWSKERPRADVGSHHLSYHGYSHELRLTTDMPLSYLGRQPFALTDTKRFVLSYSSPVEEPLAPLVQRFFTETVQYWRTWVRHCDVPPFWQAHVIRSALALKLHCFEDTGAIAAALTTSIPEAAGSGRTWDYRYCWLRDAFYALDAFRLLGHFEEREAFLNYLVTIAHSSPDLDLKPLYRIDGGSDLSERTLPSWAGYLGEGPVRVGNQAAEHQQHDVYGELVLALTPLFLDERFGDQRSPHIVDLVARLADKAARVAGTPDAGIWEFRGGWQPQTFSTLMCWAAVERASRVLAPYRKAEAERFAQETQRLQAHLMSRSVDPTRNTLVAVEGGKDVDAALLQAITLRLFPKGDPRAEGTLQAIEAELGFEGWLKRYRTDDGFGLPTVAFVICQFWRIEALARLGHAEQARALMVQLGKLNSPLGLLAEDVDPLTGRMWGNFPQAYSHVGLIHAAFAASVPWSEVL